MCSCSTLVTIRCWKKDSGISACYHCIIMIVLSCLLQISHPGSSFDVTYVRLFRILDNIRFVPFFIRKHSDFPFTKLVIVDSNQCFNAFSFSFSTISHICFMLGQLLSWAISWLYQSGHRTWPWPSEHVHWLNFTKVTGAQGMSALCGILMLDTLSLVC